MEAYYINLFGILLFCFAGWSIIFQIPVMFARINILKITVMTGTFGLAMAFAGNDLVKFIGRPVTATTIDLSRQGEGSERFDSSSLADGACGQESAVYRTKG